MPFMLDEWEVHLPIPLPRMPQHHIKIYQVTQPSETGPPKPPKRNTCKHTNNYVDANFQESSTLSQVLPIPQRFESDNYKNQENHSKCKLMGADPTWIYKVGNKISMATGRIHDNTFLVAFFTQKGYPNRDGMSL